MEPDDLNVDRIYLGIEISELAAWVAVTWGKSMPEERRQIRFATPPTPDEFFQSIHRVIRETLDGNTITGIGVASWAPMDYEHGWLQPVPFMQEWANIPIIPRLSNVLNAPVKLSPGVNAAALAEARLGAGKDTTPIVYVHLGREVLSALVYDGSPAAGAQGRIGRIGHWRIAENGPRCACGVTGHLNPLCSSQSFVRLAIGLVAQDDQSLEAVSKATGGRVEALTAQRAVALASEGIEPLQELVMHSADAMGQALAQLSLVVNPSTIVLGGPLGVAGGLFIERTRERLANELGAILPTEEAPRLVSATLEPQSALIGAWLIANQTTR
jgi:glucokinase